MKLTLEEAIRRIDSEIHCREREDMECFTEDMKIKCNDCPYKPSLSEEERIEALKIALEAMKEKRERENKTPEIPEFLRNGEKASWSVVKN